MSKALDNALSFDMQLQDAESAVDSEENTRCDEPADEEEDDGGAETECDADDRRHAKNKWTILETADLVDGCYEHGVGNWKKILHDPKYHFNKRTAVDLKDRFRTIYPQEYKRLYPGSKQVRLPKKQCEIQPPPFSRVKRKERRPFTHEEDEMLLKGVNKHGVAWARIVHDNEFKLSHRRSGDLRDRFRNAFPDEYDRLGYQTRTRRKGKKPSKSVDTTPSSTPHKDRVHSIPDEAAQALVGMSSLQYPDGSGSQDKTPSARFMAADPAAEVLAAMAATQYVGAGSQTQSQQQKRAMAAHFRSQELLPSGNSSVIFTAFGVGGAPQAATGFMPPHLASGNGAGLQQTTYWHTGAGRDREGKEADPLDNGDEGMDEEEEEEDDDDDDDITMSTSPSKQQRYHMSESPLEHHFVQHTPITGETQARKVEFHPDEMQGSPFRTTPVTDIKAGARIMGAKIDSSGEVQYKVKWRSSWQPARAIPAELTPSVTEFVKALRTQGGVLREEDEENGVEKEAGGAEESPGAKYQWIGQAQGRVSERRRS